MRFILTLHIDKTTYGNLLPLSYNYEFSSWIYKVLASSDSNYAAWLHNNGFTIEGKRFKFFVFSQLFFDDAKPLKGTDRLVIYGDQAKLFLSFLPQKSTEEFIKGIFMDRDFTLGDYKSKIELKVAGVEAIAPPDFSTGIAQFRTLSPVSISLKNDEGKIKFIAPDDDNHDYGTSLINNLKEKYRIYNGQSFAGEDDFEFQILSKPRSKLITIKSGTKEETRVRGFHFDFRLKASPELLHLLYETGAGEKNSLGFGMVDQLTKSLQYK